MVEVNIEEGLVQAQDVDILLLLKLPPFSSIHQVLLSIRMCNFKTLSSGGAKLGVDGCIKGVDVCNKGVEQTFYRVEIVAPYTYHLKRNKLGDVSFYVSYLVFCGRNDPAEATNPYCNPGLNKTISSSQVTM